jgi:dGTPase
MSKLEFYRSTDFDRVAEIPSSGSPERYRSSFRRDFARIVHAPAFRRLQRKTQLFPGDEVDFFRNRLTHSLEVAQIAKSIAIRLNSLIEDQYRERAGHIDTDLVELVSFTHDLGHPPFGHTGEYALQEKMYKVGGFEGNAQTLRILSRLEKRQTVPLGEATDFVEFAEGKDLRAGLNLSFRSLAGVLKYDNPIPLIAHDQKLTKGYYASEQELVRRIKKAVLGDAFETYEGPFRVIEMQIMDLADDIAYSTYDFEDALKAGFASPLDILQQLNRNEEIREAVAVKLFKSEYHRDFPKENAATEDQEKLDKIRTKMLLAIFDLLKDYLYQADGALTDGERAHLADPDPDVRAGAVSILAVNLQKLSDEISKNGYVRALFTSDMVGKRIRSVGIDVDQKIPALSILRVDPAVRFEIDVLKHLTYELHIKSPRLKLIEYRGKQIIHDLFDCFYNDIEGELLPNDWRDRLRAIRNFSDAEQMRNRLVCDYIAGMTDAYALDVYSRLKTTNPAALFRPS